MSKVRFLHGYQGWLTGEIYYKPGRVAEFDYTTALNLVQDGRAEFIRPEITPAAAKMAAEHKIALYQLTGTGKGGKITVDDVKAFISDRD